MNATNAAKLRIFLIVSIGIIVAMITVFSLFITQNNGQEAKAAQNAKNVSLCFAALTDRQPTSSDLEGYESIESWTTAFKDAKNTTNELIATTREIVNQISDEEMKNDFLNRLNDIEKQFKDINSIEGCQNILNAVYAVANDAASVLENERQTQAAYYNDNSDTYYGYASDYHPSDGLTAFSGVNWYGDQKETYYSSNVLYHKDTGNWTLDDEGFYRTAEGYYVVAANEGQYSYGDTYEGSKGTCQVLDSGCDYGTTDYYVAW